MPIKTETNPDVKAKSHEFFRFTTTRPVAILMVVIGIIVFGWISYKQLPLNLMPDISYPSLTVRTEYEGTAPEEIETTISRPLEQALGVVNNLVSISSISKAGQSDVKLEYSWDTDMNEAMLEAREKLDQLYLPEEVKRPIILRYDPSLDPIMRLGLYGEASLFYMRYLAEEDLKRILETVEGVAAVKVKGGLEEEIRVELDEQRLTLIGIDIQQVKGRLMQENVNLAGGNLNEGQTEYLVRTLNEFKSVDEIANVVIGNWNGREIKVRDVGQVRRTNKEREIITRINGHESVEIEIYKEADANIVAVAKRVTDQIFGTQEQQAFVAGMQASEADTTRAESAPAKKEKGDNLKAKQMTNFIAHNLPKGLAIEVLSDQSVFIESSVNEVKTTAIIGGVLAILVLLVFLRNLTATLIVGVSIPISIISTFAPMSMFQVSLNIMSLGGLALGIGMLVDNSIVVLESIARCREEGDSLIEATVRGVGEVGTAVFASTLTTVAVFFPIVFVEGVAGQVFGDLSLTVVFSLLASLLVALFLIPMLSSRESEKFIARDYVVELRKKHVFHFAAEEKLKDLANGYQNQSWGQNIGSGLSIFAATVWQFVLKVGLVFGALLLVLVKFVMLILALPLLPLMSGLRSSRLIHFSFTEKVTAFSLDQAFFKMNFVKQLWPDYLVSHFMTTFIESNFTAARKIREAGWLRRLGLCLLFLLQLVFFLARLVVQLILELIFRLFHFFLLLIGLFVKTLGIILRILLAVPAKLFVSGFNWVYSRTEAGYPRLLKGALKHRSAVLVSVLVLFLISVVLIMPKIGRELIPEVHQGEFHVDVALPVGTPVERTDQRILPIEAFLSTQSEVSKVALVAGTDKTSSAEEEQGEHTAKITVNLESAMNVEAQEERVIQKVRDFVGNLSGVRAKISRPVLFSFKTPIEVQLHGYDLIELQAITQQVEAKMAEIPGLYDVKSNMQRGNPEVQITYDRIRLARYGLNIYDVATIVRNKIRGDVATKFKERDRKIDILVRLQDLDKESISDLRRLVINPGGEVPILLEAVADIRIQEGPAEIRRVEQQRTALITANISGRDLSSASEDIYQLLADTNMPDGFTFTLAGQNKEMETSMDSLRMALALAIFLVYIVMASQFESLIHPFIIIFTIPLALIGVFIFLYLLNIPLSIVVFLGMIMLAGIVVNNAIVLVDYINQLRARGIEKTTAILQAGQVRLRPILMTTATTVLGLLPMALGLGDGAEIRTPMAITVIVGLLTSTLLTLVVIPLLYSLVDRRQ